MKYCPPPDTGLDLRYQDEHLLIVNKPAGLLSVPGRGEDKQDCLIFRVQANYPEALIVHRLDMSTSGILVLARSKTAHAQLSKLFECRQVHKRYIAVVHGLFTASRGRIALPIITDWPNRPRQMVDFTMGKASDTRFTILNQSISRHISSVLLEPLTGRTHQLRLHLQAIGHPILGDKLYAPTAIAQQSERLLLHAQSLSFQHPITQEAIYCESKAGFLF